MPAQAPQRAGLGGAGRTAAYTPPPVVRQWEFFAAAVCTFPPGVAKNHECEGDGVVVAPVAIRMAFVFSFEVDRGRAVVRQRKR